MPENTMRPAVPIIVVASAARTTSANSSNLKDLTTDFPSSGRTVALHFQVTALTINGSKLIGTPGGARFFVDTSIDGGTTWTTAWIGMDVTTSTADRVVVFRNGEPDGINSIDATKLARGSGTTTTDIPTLYPLTRDKRIRWEIGDGTGSGGNGASVTFGVYAICQPS